ncbi:response regulator [Neptunomonas sp.]|uniref:response regulator n=1 Tax=Neptunomonas TaxID=75687 RepID=UPI0035146881
MRILVVENDKILGDAINQRIRKLGHGVDLAVTGEQAKQIALSQAYDLILLDLNLPLLNGSQALKSLREQHSNTPVLILTARDQVEDRIALLDLGADGYMTKPFDFGELEARCRALLRRSQGQEGDVDMTHNGGITEDDVEDGYILSCCSVPKGNVVVEF